MAGQHPNSELETQRVNDFLRSFKKQLRNDDSLDDYLLEKAALELRAASAHPAKADASQEEGTLRLS
jgi:hypothetical protein